MNLNPFLDAIAAHRWEVLGGLVLGALVATIKQGWLGDKVQSLLPARYIPILAPLYAVLGVLAVDLAAQRPIATVLANIASAITSALIATFGHELLIESIRGGKELVPSRAKPLPPKEVPS